MAAAISPAPPIVAPAKVPAAPAEREAPPPRSPSVEILAVGDIMPSRWVEKRLLAHGFGYAFASTSEILRAGQITFGNLESPLIAGEPVEANEMNFRGDVRFAAALADAGFDVVATANNHGSDRGEEGIASTKDALEKAGVKAAGSGTLDEARAPVVIETPTGSVAFLAYADTRWIPDVAVAGESRQGVAPLDPRMISEDVAAARELADFVVVSMHAGSEYQPLPDSVQRAAAEAAARAGAALVIGHHPHVLQPVERIGTTTVAWSLGNFVFDQDWSPETQEGAIARFEISEGGVEVRVMPVRIWDYAMPRPILSEEVAKVVAEKIFARSSPCPERIGWWYQMK